MSNESNARMTITKILLGTKYINRVPPYDNFYMRSVMGRWIFLDMPILILALYIFPFQWLYTFETMQNLISSHGQFSYGMRQILMFSEFPEYSAVFLTVINLLGLLTLVLPFYYVEGNDELSKKIKSGVLKKIYRAIFGAGLMIIIFAGAIFFMPPQDDVFSCLDCGYYSKEFFVARYVFIWFILHWTLAVLLLLFRSCRSKGI